MPFPVNDQDAIQRSFLLSLEDRISELSFFLILHAS